MKISHFYHVYASGAWAEPAREHVEALGAAGFPGKIVIGLVGYAEDRERARQVILMQLAAAGLAEPAMWTQAEEGYEQLTLTLLREQARTSCPDHLVLYAHTKGAQAPSEMNTAWRRSMTAHTVTGWRRCTELLADGYDTVGCHWLTPEEYGDPGRAVKSPFYGGNFWWARADYLAALPELRTSDRWGAEEWIGLGAPRAYDLLPGWPSQELFGVRDP